MHQSPVQKNLKAIAQDYGRRVSEQGPCAKAAGWRDTQTQHMRFFQLFKLFEGDKGPYSVADLGCGYGEMLNAMPDSIKKKISLYTGYDISVEMVEAAQRLFSAEENCLFVQDSEITEPSDYVLASGIFNHHFDADLAAWKTHIQDTLRHMVKKARKGAAFNIMSTYVDYQEDYIYYADPAEMLSFCLDEFGRHVRLLHDYPLYEFTVLIKK